MRIALVFGKKLLPTGEMSAEFKAQIDKALLLQSRDIVDFVVVSGGVTRKGFLSEAETALTYISRDRHSAVFIERHSKSTSENIEFVKRQMGTFGIHLMIVISSTGHDSRIRYWVARLWPEICPTTAYASVPTTSIIEHLLQLVLYRLTVLDPDRKIFEPISHKLFRNS
jgi:hypothetical protein